MADRLQLEETQPALPLPAGGRKPGPVHSLVLDESGNYYYSDEIHHRIVSLNSTGGLRWETVASGLTPEPFRYPRGLAIGWIVADGSLHRCLAVCDSWNKRMVFLNLAGGPLHQWAVAGDIPFDEVCDVRFMSHASGPGGPDKEGHSYWLVLDKGNHRLCGLGLDGRLLFQVGRAASPSRIPAWRIPSPDWIEESARTIAVFEPRDTIYYPSRIVGGCSDAIYLWEPLARGLSQVLYGNLLPIRMQPPCDDWLAADTGGMIGWSAASRQLRRYGSSRELIAETSLEGRPVAADLFRQEVWVQLGNRLTRHTWRTAAAKNPAGQHQASFPILLDSAEEDLQLFRIEEADSARKQYFACIESLLELVDALLSYDAAHASPEPGQPPEQGRLDLLMNLLVQAWSEWSRRVMPWHVGVLKWKLTQVPGGQSRSGPLEERIRATWELLSRPFLEQFCEVMRRLDAVLLMRYELEARASETGTGSPDFRTFAARIEAELWRVLNEVGQASGVPREPGTVVDLNGSSSFLRIPTPRPRADSTLREVARWKLNDLDESFTSPHGLAASSDGSLFVTLWKSRTVLRLDKKGNMLARLDQPDSSPALLQMPGGVALDDLSRLWVVDGALNSILIWDIRSGRTQIVRGEEPEVGGLRGPSGICMGPAGFMLITDYGNHRIVRISLEGECELFAGTRGRGPGEFQHPRGLCKTTTPEGLDTFLVSDHRNHRIQRLDSAGEFMGEIGGCGLEKGKLVLPLSVAEFDDGALAVSMWHVNRRLVLLSRAGEEMGHAAIDYSPGDMVVDEGRLLVPDFEGNAIRVYERMV